MAPCSNSRPRRQTGWERSTRWMLASSVVRLMVPALHVAGLSCCRHRLTGKGAMILPKQKHWPLKRQRRLPGFLLRHFWQVVCNWPRDAPARPSLLSRRRGAHVPIRPCHYCGLTSNPAKALTPTQRVSTSWPSKTPITAKAVSLRVKQPLQLATG